MCLLAKNRKRSGKGERGRVDSLTCAVLILSDLLFPGVINICLASLITSVIARIPLTHFLLQVQRPVNVLSSMADQEFGHQIENPNLSSVEIHRTDSVDEFEVRIL